MARVINDARAESPNSDQEANDHMAEIELLKLQRQYRIMEGDRKAYSEESRLIITKQRNNIEKLKQDNNSLLMELSLIEKKINDNRKSGIWSKKALALKEQGIHYQKKLKKTQEHIRQVDREIETLDKEVQKQRSKMGGLNATLRQSDTMEKSIHILENRLDKALVRFNKALAVNKLHRGTIDNLRRERLVFDTIYRKLEKQMGDLKAKMASVIEFSNNAYEARDEAQAKIMAIKEKAEKESQAFSQEIKEMDRILLQDKKLKTFMATKILDRNEGSGSQNGNAKKQAKEIIKGSQDLTNETLHDYAKAFETIKNVTGTQDIKQLVEKFKQVADNNFSLFNFVNEVNNEIEKMKQEILAFQSKKEFLVQSELADQERRNTILAALESELQDATKKLEESETHYRQSLTTFEALKSHVATILVQLGLGEDAEQVNQSNLLKYLGMIEQKANELLTLYFLSIQPKKQTPAADEKEANVQQLHAPVIIPGGGLLGAGPAPPIDHVTVNVPSTGKRDDYDADEHDSDEEDRPLTRVELTTKSMRIISKRTDRSWSGKKGKRM